MNEPKKAPLTIRDATTDDAVEIARLFGLLGHPTTSNDVENRWDRWSSTINSVLVATIDTELVGVVTTSQMVVLHRPAPVGRVTLLVVDPTYRNRGVGKSLVTAAERILANAGCGLLEVTSNVRLVEAHGFYRHLGYQQTSIRLARTLTNRD